jgi:hypothetical protein
MILEVAMNKLRKSIKNKPHLALSVPMGLCFITFITNFIAALKDGNIDSTELHRLLGSADGFETVVLIIIMFVLKDKKK